jgi:signal transduction histidine kinase
MRRNSLALRLVAVSAIWSVVALVAAGLILTSLYRSAVERAFDERLGVNLRAVVGSLATQNPASFTDPGNFGEQRFELSYSGWYWQVRRAGGDVVLASRSLFTDILDLSKASDRQDREGMESASLIGPDDQALRFVNQRVSFGPEQDFDVTVAGDAGAMHAQVTEFQRNVFLTLAVFGLGLVLATLMMVRWGLRPLDRVRAGLADLRSGKETRFEGPFPTEIEPLARELNELLESNREVVERARTQVGNLAHALKTPLSVITNEARASEGPLAGKITEQAEIMRTQVTHYLDRARIAARAKVIGAVTEVEPVVASLVRAMERIHEDKGLDLSADVPEKALFKGEKQDLEEIIGNLLDNACKWAKGQVAISAAYVPRGADESRGKLTFDIDDDGPGLTESQRKEATRRGKRLDESKPGSGLGLNIVTELVALYGGHLRLDRSPMGGLRAEVELPGG